MKRTTFKGQHMSWFPWPKRLKGKSHTFTITIEDPEMWIYKYRGAVDYERGYIDFSGNQWDWNKLIGIKKRLFSPRKNSVMLGWRWNPIDNCLELCPYWHDENGGAHFDYKPLQIPKNRLNKGCIIVRFVDTMFSREQIINVHAYGFNKVWLLPDNAYIGTGWMMAPRFGEQETAQKKMVFNIEHRI